MEEKFFFKYHIQTSFEEAMMLPIYERKWYVHRFMEQKEREEEAMRKARAGN